MHFRSLAFLAAAAIVGSNATLYAGPASGRSLKELLQEAKKGYPTGVEKFSSASYAVSRHAARHARPDVHQTFTYVDGSTSEVRYRRILLISWFRGRGRIAIRHSVSDDRHSRSVRDVFSWARQGAGDEVLSQEKMDSLKALLPVLPHSDADPPIHRTVLVSRQVGDEWRTETYDGAKLPDALEKIFKIIGERSETKSRHNPPVAVPLTGNGRVVCPACRDTIAVDKVNGAGACGQRIVLWNPPPEEKK
jgi:hypothetical protein